MLNIELLFAKAKARGIEEVQVFCSEANRLSIDIFDGEMEKYEIADTSRMSIKGIYKGKFGLFSTEVLDDSVIDLALDSIIANASIIDSEDEAYLYPGDSHYETLKDSYNEKLTALDVGEKIAAAKELDRKIREMDPRVKVGQASYGESTHQVFLQNTKGLRLSDKANSASIGGEAIVKDDKDQRTGFDFDTSNVFGDFDLDKLSQSIVKEGIDSLGAKPVPSQSYEIVLRNDAMSVLLSAFEGMFSADAVRKNMSLLKDKIGEKIGSDLVTIVDDPFLPKSSSSRSFDDEGCATKYKELVQNGVLTTYLHNLTTSRKAGVPPTGNGFGGAVAFVNMKMLPGKDTIDDLIGSLRDGLFITGLQGAHAGANPVSGDFSLQAMGFVVKDGKIGAPVALVTVAGNIISLLKDVVAVGNDLKTSYTEVTSPSVRIRSLTVAGL